MAATRQTDWADNWASSRCCTPGIKNCGIISIFTLDYLGRYTHRVAISNNRITGLDNGHVT
ncbi:MAG: transposase, partial [Desulfatitalea sp.]|nr:transposase [Desulfatitalea sp.]